MAYINWGSHYSVGVPVMDSQHKRMADIVNTFQTSIREGSDAKRLHQLLDALLTVSLEHFEAEETMMEGIRFPGITKHREEHKLLVERLAEFCNRVESDQKLSPSDSLLFFRGWLLDHIQKQDRDYGVFLYNERAKRRAEVQFPTADKTKEPVA
jgi:hemerythrin